MNDIWFDNGTESYLKNGDKVIWINSDEEIEGTLTVINDKSFKVSWDDGIQSEYDVLYLDGIKKL